MTPTTASQWSELARRTADGVEVQLLWNRTANRVKVAVTQAGLCHHVDFELTAPEALSVFHRPFAKAASRVARSSQEVWTFG
jgi:hypothetical protein